MYVDIYICMHLLETPTCCVEDLGKRALPYSPSQQSHYLRYQHQHLVHESGLASLSETCCQLPPQLRFQKLICSSISARDTTLISPLTETWLLLLLLLLLEREMEKLKSKVGEIKLSGSYCKNSQMVLRLLCYIYTWLCLCFFVTLITIILYHLLLYLMEICTSISLHEQNFNILNS